MACLAAFCRWLDASQRIAGDGEVSSVEAKRAYSQAMARSNISPGSISDALKALVDHHVLPKPTGMTGVLMAKERTELFRDVTADKAALYLAIMEGFTCHPSTWR